MNELYEELEGLTVDARALMIWIFMNHDHHKYGAMCHLPEEAPYVKSLDLEAWLRENATNQRRRK